MGLSVDVNNSSKAAGLPKTQKVSWMGVAVIGGVIAPGHPDELGHETMLQL